MNGARFDFEIFGDFGWSQSIAIAFESWLGILAHVRLIVLGHHHFFGLIFSSDVVALTDSSLIASAVSAVRLRVRRRKSRFGSEIGETSSGSEVEDIHEAK